RGGRSFAVNCRRFRGVAMSGSRLFMSHLFSSPDRGPLSKHAGVGAPYPKNEGVRRRVDRERRFLGVAEFYDRSARSQRLQPPALSAPSRFPRERCRYSPAIWAPELARRSNRLSASAPLPAFSICSPRAV